jgi:hypothetical protein
MARPTHRISGQPRVLFVIQQPLGREVVVRFGIGFLLRLLDGFGHRGRLLACTRLCQPCFFEQPNIERVRFFRGWCGCIRSVEHFEFVPGNSKNVTRHQPFGFAAFTVDLHAISAAQIPNSPIAIDQFQLTMMRRNVGVLERNVATTATTDQQRFFRQWNRVAASTWIQLSEHRVF